MVQTMLTMFSLLLGAGGLGVIAAALAEDWGALGRALARGTGGGLPPLPPHTHRMPAPQAARIIRITPPDRSPLRAAA